MAACKRDLTGKVRIYDRASYDLVIDYSQQPVPALSETDAAWADALLQEKGIR
ncbi:DUF4058 family protein [Nostoc sp. FACHB-973]|nr:DUF4058 family protein [Nostoc sp. FACHB-973]